MSLATFKREKGDELRHREESSPDARLNDCLTVLHWTKATGNVCGCVKGSGVPVPGMDVRLCGDSHCKKFSSFNTALLCLASVSPECIRKNFHLIIFLTYERLIEM